MSQLGIVEGFFGPAWPDEYRLERLPQFAREQGLGFYVYAPKSDRWLRRGWREPWPEDEIAKLTALSRAFRSAGVGFGVGLSPFGLTGGLSTADRRELAAKTALLHRIGIDLLGLFFDDMHAFEGMAGVQVEAAQIVASSCDARIVFCPSYYSDDPVLEKVFGAMPAGYLETIAEGLDSRFEIAWTGPKVISEEIAGEHLRGVARRLGRKPFVWDNWFANDGPRGCKFLRVRPFSGRGPDARAESAGWALNPMNQAWLSELAGAGARLAQEGSLSPEDALESAIRAACSARFARILLETRESLDRSGLDAMGAEEKARLLERLQPCEDPAAAEVRAWLAGEYQVGSECLTD